MTKYRVLITNTEFGFIDLEAENEDEAFEVATELIDLGEFVVTDTQAIVTEVIKNETS